MPRFSLIALILLALPRAFAAAPTEPLKAASFEIAATPATPFSAIVARQLPNIPSSAVENFDPLVAELATQGPLTAIHSGDVIAVFAKDAAAGSRAALLPLGGQGQAQTTELTAEVSGLLQATKDDGAAHSTLRSFFDGQRSAAQVGMPAAPPSLDDLVPGNPSYLSPSEVARVSAALGVKPEQLLDRLIERARAFSRPMISGPKYAIGAAALGDSGAIYLAGNLEFTGVPYNYSVHGEQAAITHALNRSELGIRAIAISGESCGHCRQFMNELASRAGVEVWVRNMPPIQLSALLPRAYGTWGSLLKPRPTNNLIAPRTRDGLVAAAFSAADTAYSPYDSSGVAIMTKGGKVYTGGHIQVAGANPSVSPLQAALVALVVDGGAYADIDRVVLVEWEKSKISERGSTWLLLRQIAPQARLRRVAVAKKAPQS